MRARRDHQDRAFLRAPSWTRGSRAPRWRRDSATASHVAGDFGVLRGVPGNREATPRGDLSERLRGDDARRTRRAARPLESTRGCRRSPWCVRAGAVVTSRALSLDVITRITSELVYTKMTNKDDIFSRNPILELIDNQIAASQSRVTPSLQKNQQCVTSKKTTELSDQFDGVE